MRAMRASRHCSNATATERTSLAVGGFLGVLVGVNGSSFAPCVEGESAMNGTVNGATSGGHRHNFDDVRPTMAKADLTSVEIGKKRQQFGEILRRAGELASLMDKEIADRFGIDRAQLSRWYSAAENAQVWRYFADDLLGPALVAALAEATEGASIRTVIELHRKVG